MWLCLRVVSTVMSPVCSVLLSLSRLPHDNLTVLFIIPLSFMMTRTRQRSQCSRSRDAERRRLRSHTEGMAADVQRAAQQTANRDRQVRFRAQPGNQHMYMCVRWIEEAPHQHQRVHDVVVQRIDIRQSSRQLPFSFCWKRRSQPLSPPQTFC